MVSRMAFAVSGSGFLVLSRDSFTILGSSRASSRASSFVEYVVAVRLSASQRS